MPAEFEQGTFNGRTIIWKAGWKFSARNPFVGIGANAFRLLVSRELQEPMSHG